MLSLRTTRLSAFPVATTRPATDAVDVPSRWRSDQVQWGVVRARGAFDLGDSDRHAGRVRHAFPLGRDALAACGFRTPLQRAFDGTKQPLLAMPGSRNPACPECLSRVIPLAASRRIDELSDRGVDAWLRDRLAAVR